MPKIAPSFHKVLESPSLSGVVARTRPDCRRVYVAGMNDAKIAGLPIDRVSPVGPLTGHSGPQISFSEPFAVK